MLISLLESKFVSYSSYTSTKFLPEKYFFLIETSSTLLNFSYYLFSKILQDGTKKYFIV